MDTFDAIKERRSVKHYDPNHKLTDDEINQLMSLAVLSPTSFNMQNWRFVVVKDSEVKKQIRAAAWDQAQVTDSSLLIVICADLKAWKDNPLQYWINAPKETQDFLVSAMGPFYEGKEQLQRDEAMRSCGIAAQTIMLTAKAMGYDSNPMIGFDPDKVAEIIKLPENYVISMLMVVGKQTKSAMPRGGQLPLDKVVFNDRFS
ncbi:nitroreductase family protein [Nitrosopumilus cobalaminigenes]|uniref:Nitroreductase family protein n=1 Tax=Nitrosopumilus cobalaminigenes TaxID=1470066 RepID=A0A7D5R6R8_9ARCH|nr:nitroreductase family protein [Nitrosopumilus cobalaminigenes]QLH02283.1 nitroreductase family protein [Nitrosopumilus cobalaminigenes]